jgi:putative ABC transport system permease protein
MVKVFLLLRGYGMYRVFGMIKNAFRAVSVSYMRTFFCFLSVVLSIATIVLIVASVEGAYYQALEIIEKFGPDSLLIISDSSQNSSPRLRNLTLTLDDVNAMKKAFPSAVVIEPQQFIPDGLVSYKKEYLQTTIVGTPAGYSSLWSWLINEGSDITEDDVEKFKKVCLLGNYVSEILFKEQNPTGKYIMVNKMPCQVIGVLSTRGSTPSGRNLDDRIVMPITTVMKRLMNESRYVSSIRARFSNKVNLSKKAEEVRSFLRYRHGLSDSAKDDFRMISPDTIISFMVSLTGSLVAFLGVTGVVTVIISGFVLANLFLLSVQERKQEIGIRRALGAKKRDIIYQFLLESIFITLSGGVGGFLAARLAERVIIATVDFPLYFSWKVFVTALIFSLAIGLIFGIKPATTAANLNPIDTIR